MNIFPIFFSFDDNYVVPAAVTFESLLSHAGKGNFYELHVVHENITLENRARLEALVNSHGNACLSFIDAKVALSGIDIKFTDDNFSTGDHKAVFTKETLFRCLPTLIADFDRYEKILYSDVDICVVDDISDLFEIDLSECYLAGCKAPQFLDYQIAHLPKKFIGNYFAGGLWLMNLDKMRQDNLADTILDIIKAPPFRLIWNDQDVMNLACNLKVRYISYRYISIPAWDKDLKRSEYLDEYYPNGELYDAIFRPKIIHFAYIKPWKERCAGEDVWYYWLNKTGFHASFQHSDFVTDYKKRIKMRFFSLIPIPRFLIDVRRKGSGLIVRIFGFFVDIRIQLH
jgi:lipopolysaccharide biosynthesis glycosyltransferase